MWHLLNSELVRFRRPAIGFALAHLVVLGYLAGGDLFAPSLPRIAVGLLVYALGGLLLGLYQMRTHARPNRWTYLVHRPLAPRRIHLALTGAAAAVLLVAVTLPQLLVVAGVEMFTTQPVDGRHLLLVVFVFGTAFSFYLAGAFIALSPTRGALLVLALPLFFLTRDAVGAWVLVPLAVVLLWLAWLSLAAFKPDLAAPLRRPRAVIAAALPMQYALFWLLVAGLGVGYQMGIIFHQAGWRGPAVFAWDDYFPDGSYDHVVYLDGAAALTHGLATADGGRAAELRGQIRLADVAEIRPRHDALPVRHQPLFMDRSPVLVDEETGVRWSFQHDPMLFFGRDLRTGAPVGWLGPEGRLGMAEPSVTTPRFPAVPRVAANRFPLTAGRLWEYEPRTQTLRLRFVAAPGERLAAPLALHHGVATLLSDRALYLFAPRDLERGDDLLAPTAIVPLPGDLRNLERVDVAELIDGHLVSFLLGEQSARDLYPARQVVVEVGLDGTRHLIAERPLQPMSFSVWYRHRGFVVSPVWQLLDDAVWGLVAPARPQRVSLAQVARRPPPPAIRWAALAVALVSAALAAAFARRRSLTVRGRWAWTVACGLAGPPALISLWLLTAPAEPASAAAGDRRRRTAPALARGAVT